MFAHAPVDWLKYEKMATQPGKVGRPKLSESVKNWRRKETLRASSQSIINIGNEINRWNGLRDELGCVTNRELATVLLDKYRSTCTKCQEVDREFGRKASIDDLDQTQIEAERKLFDQTHTADEAGPSIPLSDTSESAQGRSRMLLDAVESQANTVRLKTTYYPKVGIGNQVSKWKKMATDLGVCDRDLAKVLLDRYVMSRKLFDNPRGNTDERLKSEPYIITLCVTEEQERSIQMLCELRDWPYSSLYADKLPVPDYSEIPDLETFTQGYDRSEERVEAEVTAENVESQHKESKIKSRDSSVESRSQTVPKKRKVAVENVAVDTTITANDVGATYTTSEETRLKLQSMLNAPRMLNAPQPVSQAPPVFRDIVAETTHTTSEETRLKLHSMLKAPRPVSQAPPSSGQSKQSEEKLPPQVKLPPQKVPQTLTRPTQPQSNVVKPQILVLHHNRSDPAVSQTFTPTHFSVGSQNTYFMPVQTSNIMINQPAVSLLSHSAISSARSGQHTINTPRDETRKFVKLSPGDIGENKTPVLLQALTSSGKKLHSLAQHAVKPLFLTRNVFNTDIKPVAMLPESVMSFTSPSFPAAAQPGKIKCPLAGTTVRQLLDQKPVIVPVSQPADLSVPVSQPPDLSVPVSQPPDLSIVKTEPADVEHL